MPLRIARARRFFSRIAWGWLAVAAGSAQAQDEGTLETVTVTAGRLSAGAAVAPETGVTSYTADQAQIQTIPGGDSVPFQQVLLRMPGVVQDSYGELHIRGEHGNAGYRIDGVMLPEGLEGFGQEFDSHFIASATLLTGALPAQYGLRLSGLVDITTKSGADLNGGEAGVYGGSFGTVRPYFDFGRSAGNLDYFVSFSDLRDGLGIENPTPSTTALHADRSKMNLWMVTLLLFIIGSYAALTFGPLAAFLVEHFPTRIRYTSVSVAYNLGGMVGGLTPFFISALSVASGDVYFGLWFPVLLSAGVVVYGAITIREYSHRRIREI